MFDMLSLVSDEPINDDGLALITKEYELTSQGTLDKHYCYATVFYKNDFQLFSIKTKPRQQNLKQTCLQINPSKFDCFLDLSHVVHKVLSGVIYINRIDFCVDINISIDDLQSRLRIKSKQKRTEFEEGSRLTGFYFGTRAEVIAIYDKSYQLNKKSLKLSKTGINVDRTRIEVRKKGAKVSINQFNDLKEYINLNPFSSVLILDFNDPELLKENARQKAVWFQRQCEQIGFNQAYRMFNTSNNFSKTFSRYISDSNLNEEILKTYQQTLSTFLGVQIEEVNQSQ